MRAPAPDRGPLEELRETLATALKAAGLFAFAAIPDKVTPPLAYVAPDDPYLTWDAADEASFGEAVAHHQVVVVTKAGTGGVRVPALEVDVMKAVKALNAVESTDVTAVGGFYSVTLPGSGQHMACAIETRTYTPLDV